MIAIKTKLRVLARQPFDPRGVPGWALKKLRRRFPQMVRGSVLTVQQTAFPNEYEVLVRWFVDMKAMGACRFCGAPWRLS